MRAVVQRVKRAWVQVSGQRVGEIGEGALVFLGIAIGDTSRQCQTLSSKILHLRIFDDDEGKMNLSLQQTRGDLLVVSQFTLLGNCRRGRRPSFADAAPPEEARRLYELFLAECQKSHLHVASGIFQARMEVESVNNGPVTLILESP